MQMTFHVGLTAWSWGYNMLLSVDAIDSTHAKVVIAVQSKSGGDALSWGSGKKEVRKILGGIDAELAAAKASLKELERAQVLCVSVVVFSVPTGLRRIFGPSFPGTYVPGYELPSLRDSKINRAIW